MTPLSMTPLLALALTIALHLLALKLFPRLGLLDFPERYGLIRTRLAYPTGIIAVVNFLVFYAWLSAPVLQTAGVIGAVVILALFTFHDDRTPLSPWLRTLVHVAVAVCVFVTGTRIYSLTNPLPSVTGFDVLELNSLVIHAPFFGALPLVSAVFTVVWLGLTINALNWFDGIPGQVTTLSTIAFLTIGALSVSERVNQPSLALLAFVLAGIAGGSLLFDFPTPKVVLGDTGAMFFGLMIGILTIYSGGKVATAFLVLGVPLIDFALVILRRLLKGRSIVARNASDEHLHHRLLAKGWSPRAVIALTAGIGTAFGVTALFLDTFQKFVAAGVLFILMMGLSWYSSPLK